MTGTTAPPDRLPMVPAGDLEDLQDPHRTEPLSVTLDRIVAFNRRFIHHSNESSHWLTALWVASTHGMNVWDWHGRLYITAPDRGVGKSTAAEVMASLCPNSDPTGSTSGPGLFRNISANQPTLFLDEAESQFSNNAGRDGDIVNQVINSGYKRGAFVTRSEGNKAVKHSTYAAVCIIGIDNGTLRETTRSRCIPVQMTPGTAGMRLERFRPRKYEEFAQEVRTLLSNAAFDWDLHELDPEDFTELRQVDLWESLYSVAVAAGPLWVEKFKVAAQWHVWPDNSSDTGSVLRAIRDYFVETKADKVESTALLAYLNGRDDLPHVTSTRALARVWLRGYRTADGQHIKARKRSTYWYHLADFEHAFKVWVKDDE